jgi:flagellar protein FliO/FliZ
MDSFVQFITVLLIFVFVLAITYFVTRWIGGFNRRQSISGNIEVIESARIAPNIFVEIVRIGKRYVALSVSKESSAYICDVPEEDIVFREDGSAGGVNFSDILNKVRNRSDAEDMTGPSESHRDE